MVTLHDSLMNWEKLRSKKSLRFHHYDIIIIIVISKIMMIKLITIAMKDNEIFKKSTNKLTETHDMGSIH